MKTTQAVALHWARALFEEAKSKSAIGTVQNDLVQILQSRRSGDNLWEVLEHPLLPAAKAKELLNAAYKGKLHDITLRFLALLVARRRLGYLSYVDQQLGRLADVDSGVVRAQIKCVFPLSDVQHGLLKKALEKFYSKRSGESNKEFKVILDVRSDPNLIAGIAVRMEDWTLSHSVRSQLQQLREMWSA